MQVNNSIALSPREKLVVSRYVAAEIWPYYRTALLALVPHEMPGLGTLGVTENAILLWDPEFVKAQAIERLAGAMLHEVGHVLQQHTHRCAQGGYHPRNFNIASDLELNDDIQRAGIAMPEWQLQNGKKGQALFPKDFGFPDGRTAEEYYRMCEEQAQKNGKGPAGGDGSDDRPGIGWCGSGGGRELPNEPKSGKGQGEGQGDGNKDKKEGKGQGGGSDAGDVEGRSETELARVRRQTAEDIRDACEKSRGSVPGGLRRWADQFLKPAKVRWQDKLARACRTAVAYRPGAFDYTRSRPSRRQWAMNFALGEGRAPLLPAMHRPVPLVAFWLDTSGSMSEDDIKEGLQEAAGILKAVGASIQYLAVDAGVQHVQKVARVEDLFSKIKGGGGTDFRAPFEWLAKQRSEKPELIVYATDGIGPAPAHAPPGITVIWLLCGASAQRPYCEESSGKQITWGEFVRVHEGGRDE